MRATAIGAALLLEALLGDPTRHHPLAGFGCVAEQLERLLWCDGRLSGALHVAAPVAGTAGVAVFPSAANFLLVQTPRQDVAERLRERGIAVRPAADFAGLTSEHVRITARSPRENETFVRALVEVLARA